MVQYYVPRYERHIYFDREAVAQLEASRYKEVIFVSYVLYPSPCIRGVASPKKLGVL